jgi:prepilin-type N-terminal cleavage/methylation domain-containing protein
MNNVFTAKLLNNLRNKKGNKGFTLIELLVVVIIIGVLAAVALPNLLGQVGKGRQAEAKNVLGTINRNQQAHRMQFGTFGEIGAYTETGGQVTQSTAPTATNALPVSFQLQYYQVQDAAAPSATLSTVNANSITRYTNDILDYQAQVSQDTTGNFASIICEESEINAADQAGNGAATTLATACTGGNEVN